MPLRSVWGPAAVDFLMGRPGEPLGAIGMSLGFRDRGAEKRRGSGAKF